MKPWIENSTPENTLQRQSNDSNTINTLSEINANVRLSKLDLLYEQIIVGIIAQILGLFLIFFALKESSQFNQLLYWLSYMSVAMTVWLAFYLAYMNKSLKLMQVQWMSLFAAIAFLSGCGWGFLGYALIPEDQHIQQTFIAILLFALSAGAIPFLSPFLFIYALFLIPTLLPFIVWLFSHAGDLSTILGVCISIYLIAMFSSCYYSHKILANSIYLKEQNVLLATRDILTGLPNKALMYDRINQSISYIKRFHSNLVLYFIDIDNFKLINDNLGHDIGDKVLVEIAHRLQTCVRESDSISRYGGDEFVILFLTKDLAKMHLLSKKLLSEITKPILVNGHKIIVTGSIGASIYPKDGKDASTLLKKADMAMYHAKTHGKNNFKQFIENIIHYPKRQLQTQLELYNAFNQKEFFLLYQPILNLKTNKIIGVEALLRWKHPEQGIILPSYFIPFAEESGFIIQLGQWVFEQACQQNARWQAEGLPKIPISINVSALEIQDEGFEKFVDKVLKTTKLDPSFIEIELNEHALTNSSIELKRTLNQLKDKGIELAIDDFGIGYSALNYLRQFPIDRLKIDRSFIHNITVDENDASIVQAFLTLGQGLNLKLLAEGIEKKEELEFLIKNNCQEGQGYLFSHPLSAEKFAKLLAKEKIESQG